MKKYLVPGFICTLLFASASAFASTVVTVTANDGIYNRSGFVGTIQSGATGFDATIKFTSPVFGDPFTINFTNAGGIIQDSLYSNARFGEEVGVPGHDLQFDGLLSGNAIIGTACVAGGNIACIQNTGDIMHLADVIQGLTGGGIFGGGDITVQIGAQASPVPEPSSLMLLGTGILGALGATRRRFAR